MANRNFVSTFIYKMKSLVEWSSGTNLSTADFEKHCCLLSKMSQTRCPFKTRVTTNCLSQKRVALYRPMLSCLIWCIETCNRLIRKMRFCLLASVYMDQSSDGENIQLSEADPNLPNLYSFGFARAWRFAIIEMGAKHYARLGWEETKCIASNSRHQTPAGIFF